MCEVKDKSDLVKSENDCPVEAVMGAGVHNRSKVSGRKEKRARVQELMNLYCGVTLLCCSPFLTENTVINLHFQSWASQREDQCGHYLGYLRLLDLCFMTKEPNLQLQSFNTPLHMSLSIAKVLQQQFKRVVGYTSDWFKGFFLGASIPRKEPG